MWRNRDIVVCGCRSWGINYLEDAFRRLLHPGRSFSWSFSFRRSGKSLRYLITLSVHRYIVFCELRYRFVKIISAYILLWFTFRSQSLSLYISYTTQTSLFKHLWFLRRNGLSLYLDVDQVTVLVEVFEHAASRLSLFLGDIVQLPQIHTVALNISERLTSFDGGTKLHRSTASICRPDALPEFWSHRFCYLVLPIFARADIGVFLLLLNSLNLTSHGLPRNKLLYRLFMQVFVNTFIPSLRAVNSGLKSAGFFLFCFYLVSDYLPSFVFSLFPLHLPFKNGIISNFRRYRILVNIRLERAYFLLLLIDLFIINLLDVLLLILSFVVELI